MNRKPIPCHVCDGRGLIEDGERIDVDDFRDCGCDNCDGTGIEPWRAAGDRYTGTPARYIQGFGGMGGGFGDILEVLAKARQRHIDSNGEYPHRDIYESLRRRAFVKVSRLAQAEMLAKAQLCANEWARMQSAALERSKKPQPDPLRFWNPSQKGQDPQRIIPYHARLVRAS